MPTEITKELLRDAGRLAKLGVEQLETLFPGANDYFHSVGGYDNPFPDKLRPCEAALNVLETMQLIGNGALTPVKPAAPDSKPSYKFGGKRTWVRTEHFVQLLNHGLSAQRGEIPSAAAMHFVDAHREELIGHYMARVAFEDPQPGAYDAKLRDARARSAIIGLEGVHAKKVRAS